ncbi:phosphatase PAP2 family protein [Paraburkholderia ginsengisoli]|uniref:Phosphatase PAP2 family protein n=1 Tax=Paraburkholderia ginsengisoli TaxID=311231 RepID=A0A7T4N865_9BURK|nr:phosphatase PAP2 family protein [Paraburkholderia ginsengisoli]QQC67002.1 phosphatase PAP2 family protein [Paraburkholderia ginsengisoli]
MWKVFANLGDAAITLPVAAICAGWIALFNVRLALRLVGVLALGAALVGVTKVVYAGWGLSIPAEDFRVISGHAMLSTSIWMVAITLLLKWWRQPAFPGIVAGLVIGALTGFSRIIDHSHSVPEVIAGWSLGAIAGLFFLRAAVNVELERFSAIWPTLSILLVSTLAYGHKAPFEHLIETRSPQLRSHVPSVMAVLGRIRYRVQSHDATSAR